MPFPEMPGLDYIKCPLCLRKTSMMPSVNPNAMRCVTCEEDFEASYLIPFWRGFYTAEARFSGQMKNLESEWRAANRMLWAAAYSQPSQTLEVNHLSLTQAGDPGITIEAFERPEDRMLVIKAGIKSEEEMKKAALPGDEPPLKVNKKKLH